MTAHRRGPRSLVAALAALGALVTSSPAPSEESNAAPAKPVPSDPCASTPSDMACVPAGEFTRGLDVDPHRCGQSGQPATMVSSSVPSSRVWLDAYFIDRTEVTVDAYRACVQRGACKDVHPLYAEFDALRLPMTGLSWFEAQAYCRANGRRLPTEAEWEKAARGPNGERGTFGDAPIDCSNAIVEDARGRSCGVRAERGDPSRGRLAHVGSLPPGRYGLFDMAGNAEEWVADWWTESYAACGADCSGPNPRGPCGGGAEPCPRSTYKVVRGGSWYWRGEHADGFHRRRHWPANEPAAYHHFGFRCAADAPKAATPDAQAR